MTWEDLDWPALDRLRAGFLEGAPNSGPYWKSTSDLASYDFTYGERIGWKWDAVIAELKARGWTPPPGNILDFGCGTGVASRRVLDAWPAAGKLMLWDRSPAAIQFAKKRALGSFPGVPVETWAQNRPPAVLVVSHVLNELPKADLERLIGMAASAQAVLWIEPGTAAVSRALIEVRNRLVGYASHAAKPFRPIAPCTHSLACGMLAAGNERHWCHHFAKVPAAIYQDAGWGRFAKTMEVDLRSIPFSFLVLDRSESPLPGPEEARVIGHPRHYKGFDKVLCCRAEAVSELMLQKRDVPELFKEMKKEPGSLYDLTLKGDKIQAGTRIF